MFKSIIEEDEELQEVFPKGIQILKEEKLKT